MKTNVEELKESFSLTQNDIDQRFLNINEKVQSLEKELRSTRGRWCYTSDKTNMDIGNSQKISGSQRWGKKKQFANTRYYRTPPRVIGRV